MRLSVMSRRTIILLALLLLLPSEVLAAGTCDAPDDDRCETWARIWDSGLNETSKGAYPEYPADAEVARGALYVAGESHDGHGDSDVFLLKLSTDDGQLLWETRYGGRSPVEGREFDAATALDVSGRRIFVTGRRNSDQMGRSDLLAAAFDTATGKKLWAVAVAKGRAWGADVAASPDGSVVYVSGSARRDDRRQIILAALRASDGATLWEYYRAPPGKAGRAYGTQLIATGDRLYAQGTVRRNRRNYDYLTLAFDVSGKTTKLWRTFTNSDAPGYGYGSAMALPPDGKRLFVGGSHQDLSQNGGQATASTYALDATTGAIVWSDTVMNPMTKFQSAYELALSPSGEHLYVAGIPDLVPSDHFENFVARAYAAGDGSVLWTTKYEPATADVYVADLGADGDGPIVSAILMSGLNRDLLTLALDGNDGSTRWSARFRPSDELNAEVNAQGALAIGANGSIYNAGEMYSGNAASGYAHGDVVIAAYR